MKNSQKKSYAPLTISPIGVEPEKDILTGSVVTKVKMEVEVDDYIKIEDMSISFD